MSDTSPKYVDTDDLPMLTFGMVTVCDERPRTDIDTTDREFSVTLDSVTGESSWGEFFSREDAEKLRDWLTEALRH